MYMELHYHTERNFRWLALGVLLTVLLAAMFVAARPAQASTTFTVTNTNDSGAGSLRQAITDANNAPGADTINFNIPGGGVHTITPANELPAITDPVTINGYSQPGSHPNTKAVGNDAVLNIELSGASAPGYGLFVIGSNSTIKGLVVDRWSGAGIVLIGTGATGNRVAGNFIGTDPTGTQDYGNSMFGVYVNQASGNTIGGAKAAARNVISGNEQVGVYVEYANSTNNTISGNYIGTDRTGTKDLGNSGGVAIQGANNTVGGTTAGERNVISGNNVSGVNLFGAGGNKVTGNYVGTNASGTRSLGNSSGVAILSPNNTIGGTTAGERNVVSGNNSYGIFLFDGGADTTTGNKIVGNYVGTDKTGTKALGNDYGVNVTGASNTTIGGTKAAARNLISGNDYDGVYITGQFAKGNKVVGNYVGTAKNGTDPLGNGYAGVNVTGASNTTIGGTKAGTRNVIAANGHEGVFISTNASTGNRVLSNSIYANGRLGIDLSLDYISGDGPTANDPGDTDTGPNGLQNFPVLSSAMSRSTKTTVKGKLNSTPAKTFTIQFFSNPRGNEGKKLIGQKSVTTDGNGDVNFTFSTNNKVAAGQTITATATGEEGTSEFSAPKKVVAK